MRPVVFGALWLSLACGKAETLATLDASDPIDAGTSIDESDPIDADAIDASDPIDAAQLDVASPLDATPPLDTTDPFPIDRSEPGDPTTYKSLPLGLVDNGEPSVDPVDGVIGVVCIGMSNSSQECNDYVEKLRTELAGQVNPEVRVVNCAVGGHAIERWIDPAHDDTLWDACIDRKIATASVTIDQVRVLYHKVADQFTTSGNVPYPPYPDPESDYFNFYDNLTAFSARVKTEFPAVQAVYSTSRSYGGFANNPGRGEPLSYEEGHALNTWLRDNPSVDGVWYGWGPYIWGPDCATGESNASGVCYVRTDYVQDGVHPAQGGRDKISRMIHARFSQHAWYRP